MHSSKKVKNYPEQALSQHHEILRCHLIQQVFSKLQKRPLLWMSAPAGYGKSTLMKQCFEQCQYQGIAAKWLSIDELRDEIQKMPYNSSKPDDSYLFIDHISPEKLKVHASELTFLIKNKKCIISSRHMPNSEILEYFSPKDFYLLNTPKIKMNFIESKSLLQDLMKIVIDETMCFKIYQKTHGWPIALKILATELTKIDKGSRENFIEEFSGAYHEIQNYFNELVMSKLSDEEREYILACAIFKSFDNKLIQKIFPDSKKRMKELYEKGLFMQKRVQKKGHFRFIAFFQEYLISQIAMVEWEKALAKAKTWLKQFTHPEDFIFEYPYKNQIIKEKKVNNIYPSNQNSLGETERKQTKKKLSPLEKEAPLSSREKELIEALRCEEPLEKVAAKLHISKNTLKTHLKNLYKKFHVNNRASLLVKIKNNPDDTHS
ncbi:MAG: hypothetical protein H7A32_00100 [Deltaproteobacteria bacterium]|nr:hypothetical protein [Deltaproteobacteria bacterium]